jgi:hypothetical protein
MATVSFNNVTFLENRRDSFDLLDTSTSKFKLYRYPQDLGSAERGHYMVFFIREQKDTNFGSAKRGAQRFNDKDTISQKLSQGNPEKGTFITDKSPFAIMNRTVLTNESIVLYMPDTLNFDTQQNYSSLEPGKELLGQALSVGPELLAKYQAGDFKGMAGTAIKSGVGYLAAQAIAEKVPLLGGSPATRQLGLFAAFGQVLNPMIELLYTSPQPREFQFEFMFYPRSEEESKEVLNIIELFKFHASPELGGSGMLIPPSEFDMKFFYRGKENPNIPPIGTCVLKSIQTNYAPRGFAAYESFDNNSPEKGGTGMPVAITMTLSFSETTYLTKEDYSFDKNDPAVPVSTAPSPASASSNDNYVALYNRITTGNKSSNTSPQKRKRKKNKTPSQGVNTGVDAGIAAGKKTNDTRAKAREDNRYLMKYGLGNDMGAGVGG